MIDLTTASADAGGPYPPPPPPLTVHAKWRARSTTGPHGALTESHIDLYDVLLCPRKPLEVGLLVSICALSLVAYHAPAGSALTAKLYDTYDPEIVGPIVAIRAEEKEMVEFVVHNLSKGTPVKYAYLSVQYVPGVTARMDLIGRARRWFFEARLPYTRAVPIEWDARVLAGSFGHPDATNVPRIWTGPLRSEGSVEDASLLPPAPPPSPMSERPGGRKEDTPPPSPDSSALATKGNSGPGSWEDDGSDESTWEESRDIAAELGQAGWSDRELAVE